MKKKFNPHCPIPGCKAIRPHADDPIVKGMLLEFSSPEKITQKVHEAIAELNQSICRDLKEGKIFAWHLRLRQPEELYIRTLYALFIANDLELLHLLSGEWPNGFTPIYEKVNDVIFLGNGQLQNSQSGLFNGNFKPMDILNDGAHASFRAIMTSISIVNYPEYLPSPEKYSSHLEKYCSYLDYMNGMFKVGKDKKDILTGLINLHRPASHWASI